jgi:hypothetical protein
MKNFIWLFLILALGVWGCMTVDHATLIDTDKDGYANGQFRDVRNGNVADVSLYGGGAGAAASSAAASALSALAASNAANSLVAARGASSNNTSSGGGGGMFGLHVKPGPTQGDPVPFAKSVAMINYSKRLQSIKYDEMGGVIEYEFGPGPMSMRSDSPAPKGTKMPSAFGHQPVE